MITHVCHCLDGGGDPHVHAPPSTITLPRRVVRQVREALFEAAQLDRHSFGCCYTTNDETACDCLADRLDAALAALEPYTKGGE
jgi:hypothetical protein